MHSYAFQFGCIQQISYWTRGQNMLLPAPPTPPPPFSQSHRICFFSMSQLFLAEMTKHCTFNSLFILPFSFPHSSFFHVVLSSPMFSFLPDVLSEPHTPMRDEAVRFLCVCVSAYEVSQLGSLPSQL